MLRPTYPIKTRRLALRPYAADDLDALFAIESRADVCKYLYWEPRTRAEVAADLERRMATTTLENEGDALRLAVTLLDTGELIGGVMLAWRSVEHSGGEIGFVLHPDHHGRGYAGEAAVQLLRLGFEDLGLHRVFARLDAANRPSGRLLERLGMRFEGRFRENEFVKGAWTDEAVYAMLAHEWRDLTEG
ncbi:GNAT family N-acetyltransferase [Actinokineospora iranica]|uniref:Protein N-acetyltransferase, RimJ/RimL family n=1 Tax=Actinokineospora iranica TaxID=1271860 RepID=A0A1G6SMI9_9PSEU|nr:GNAT family protein [Actinokineospora iranica]SDD17346.1 Protein N-acetyltransferase, RimJ/RimL family [Actinokineospora iranica]